MAFVFEHGFRGDVQRSRSREQDSGGGEGKSFVISHDSLRVNKIWFRLSYCESTGSTFGSGSETGSDSVVGSTVTTGGYECGSSAADGGRKDNVRVLVIRFEVLGMEAMDVECVRDYAMVAVPSGSLHRRPVVRELCGASFELLQRPCEPIEMFLRDFKAFLPVEIQH